MVELWMGEIVGQMHVMGITNRNLAEYLGCTEEYVSMVLNGKRSPKNAKQKYEQAVDEIIKNRNQQITR